MLKIIDKPNKSSLNIWLRGLIFGTASIFTNLVWISAVWGQSTLSSTAIGETASPTKEKQALSIQEFQEKERNSKSAADLLTSCDRNASKMSQIDLKSNCQAQIEPSRDRLRINIGNENPRGFSFGFGSQIGEPTALQGETRPKVVFPRAETLGLFTVILYLQQGLGNNQRLLLEGVADFENLAADLSYTIAPESIPGGFSINGTSQRARVSVFEEGDDVSLSGGDDPWVHRLGGGIEYFVPFSDRFALASGLNYQLVSVRPGAFTDRLASVDELGFPVTVNRDGEDSLLTFNLASLFTAVDDPAFPSRGTKLKLGIDTSIPIGDASIEFGRFSGNVSQFIPANIFGFAPGPRTLIFNLQGGAMVGDKPPYEAFSLGGSESVRGYNSGEVSSGSSFIVASAEYRFPIANDLRVLIDFDLQGSLFFDYGSDLGTADEVIGIPAIVRNKPGDGFGYGVGVHAKTAFGLVRLELGLNDREDFTATFTIGDRY